MVALNSSAHASSSDCLSIAAPMERLACYDKAANATAPSGKTAVNRVEGAALNAIPAKIPVKALSPVRSGPRFWLEAEGGIYGFSKNQPILSAIAAPGTSGPTPIPTAPGFAGLFTVSTVTHPFTNVTPADVGGRGR